MTIMAFGVEVLNDLVSGPSGFSQGFRTVVFVELSNGSGLECQNEQHAWHWRFSGTLLEDVESVELLCIICHLLRNSFLSLIIK